MFKKATLERVWRTSYQYSQNGMRCIIEYLTLYWHKGYNIKSKSHLRNSCVITSAWCIHAYFIQRWHEYGMWHISIRLFFLISVASLQENKCIAFLERKKRLTGAHECVIKYLCRYTSTKVFSSLLQERRFWLLWILLWYILHLTCVTKSGSLYMSFLTFWV